MFLWCHSNAQDMEVSFFHQHNHLYHNTLSWRAFTHGDLDVCDFTVVGAMVDLEGRPYGNLDKDCDTDIDDFRLFLIGFTGPTP